MKLYDEDKAMILLCSLPSFYEHFVDTLMYGRQTLIIAEVKETFSLKQATKKEMKEAKGLLTRGKSEKREDSKGKKKRSKSRPKNVKCFHCHKKGCLKKGCPDRTLKHKDGKERNDDAAITSKGRDSDGYDSSSVLIVISGR